MTRTRILLAAGVLAAFLAGSVFAGFIVPRLAGNVAAPPSPAPVYAQAYAPRTISPARRVSPPPRKRHTWKRDALLIGGGAAAGAAIGGAAKGGKGAAVGALAGGVAGLIYDVATRNH